MNKLQAATLTLAKASEGNPVISTLVVMLFYLMFNFVEALTEKAIFGQVFAHFLDPLLALIFMAYSAYAVYWCAVFNTNLREGKETCRQQKEQK